MSPSPVRACVIVGVLSLSGVASGQASLQLRTDSAPVGDRVQVPLTLSTDLPVQGLVAAFEWDGSVGTGVDLVSGVELLVSDFVQTRVEPDFIVVGAVRDFDDVDTYGPGAGLDLGSAVIECKSDGSSPVTFVDGVHSSEPGGPPVDNIVVIGGQAVGVGNGLEVVDGSFECAAAGPPVPVFRRGDATGNGFVNICDAISILRFLFVGGPPPGCFDAADTQDDGQIVLSDAIFLLVWLFLGGAPPPPPGPMVCGAHPTPDGLGCDVYDSCDAPSMEPLDPRFELGFECPVKIEGEPGSTVDFMGFVTITNDAPAEGWSFGVQNAGSGPCEIVAATIAGTDAEVALTGGFEATTVGPDGVVSATILHLIQPADLRPGVHTVLKLTIRATIPEEGCTTCNFEFVSLPAGGGPSADIVIFSEFECFRPVLTGKEIEICAEFVGAPPDCSEAALSVSTCWPPNHEFVGVEVLGVTDPDGDDVTITIDSITQDEPVRSPGRGSGHTCPDAARMDADGDGNPETAMLRCERDGTGNGRVYVVQFTATDTTGQSCSGSLPFCVPHDERPGAAECIDDGQDFDSTMCPDGGSGGVFTASDFNTALLTEPLFLRGDVDWDEELLITDGIIILDSLFRTGKPFDCPDAADVNDDGLVDISDPIGLFAYLFIGNFTMPPPLARVDADPTDDDLSCE